MEYGEKITALRKAHKMTQAELGAALNVTFQAVSKWERGESYPDFETLSKISKLFNVPISYFEEETAVDSVAATAATAAPTAPAAPTAEMIGVCTVCGKVVHEGEGAQTTPVLVCADCCRAREESERQAVAKKERAEQARVDDIKRMRNRGLIFGAIITLAIIVGVLVSMINAGEGAGLIAGVTAICVLFVYPFVAQMFWDGLIFDVCLCGGKIIGGPGVIFSLDLDGILFLIGVKILFLIIKILFFVASLAFFVFVAMVMSPFTFIPALVKLNRGHELG